MGGGKRQLPSIFFLRGDSLEYVRAGSSFRRVRPDRMVETAEVTGVYMDSFGIPHIRFDVTFEKPHRPSYREGSRVLALKTFTQTFVERVCRPVSIAAE